MLLLCIAWILNLLFLWLSILSVLVNVLCTLEFCFLVKWFIIINHVRLVDGAIQIFYILTAFLSTHSINFGESSIEIANRICVFFSTYPCGLSYLFASSYLEWISYRQPGVGFCFWFNLTIYFFYLRYLGHLHFIQLWTRLILNLLSYLFSFCLIFFLVNFFLYFCLPFMIPFYLLYTYI